MEILENKNSNDPIKEAVEFGIDLTLFYERLELTPTQRIEKHQQILSFVEELRRASGKKNG
ncbi:MAG: hypothetical protein EHM58_16000 [Ignavibacteriae bacterium]|nr:MAG: hypothetical protein EHM58_16000 [Ignavibacteriota bacterium]